MNKKSGISVIPTTQEVEGGKLKVEGQPGKLSDILFKNKVRKPWDVFQSRAFA